MAQMPDFSNARNRAEQEQMQKAWLAQNQQTNQPAPNQQAPTPVANTYQPQPMESFLQDSLYPDKKGILKPQFTLQKQGDVQFNSNMSGLNSRLSGINLNTDALKALRERGLATGDSKWADLQLQKQGMDEQDAAAKALAQNRSATSTAQSDLARRGGLSSGARERLATSGATDSAMGQQANTRAGMMARLGIRSDDENKKLDVLKMLPGAEVQALQPELQKTSMWQQLADSEGGRKQNLDLANRAYSSEVDKTNIANTLGVKQNEDAMRLKKYEEDMKGYAADQQAKAQASAGGGGKK